MCGRVLRGGDGSNVVCEEGSNDYNVMARGSGFDFTWERRSQ